MKPEEISARPVDTNYLLVVMPPQNGRPDFNVYSCQIVNITARFLYPGLVRPMKNSVDAHIAALARCEFNLVQRSR